MKKRLKALRILLLALKINNTPTEKALTGNKPTIVVEFMGHTTTFNVIIFPEGWKEDCKVADSIKYNCVFSNDDIDEVLDECISLLEIIWKEWKSTT